MASETEAAPMEIACILYIQFSKNKGKGLGASSHAGLPAEAGNTRANQIRTQQKEKERRTQAAGVPLFRQLRQLFGWQENTANIMRDILLPNENRLALGKDIPIYYYGV